MNKLKYLSILLLGGVALTSCLDDNTEDYSAWKSLNDTYFQTASADSLEVGYNKLHSLSYPSYYILYKVVEETTKEDPKKPYQTSTVSADYSGQLISYDDTTFFDTGKAVTFAVNGVIKGWTLALENMKEGETWKVIIPQELGYGISGSGSIPPYSTLLFDIKLNEVTKWEKSE